METIIIKSKLRYALLVSSLLILSSCGLLDFELPGDGFDAAQDSGFDLTIKNFSETEYNNCTFYMGYKDIRNQFVAIDSIVYNNIVIHKKGGGNLYNEEGGYSLTYPFNFPSIGLNKYGYWEPDIVAIKQFSIDNSPYFKINLEGVISVSSKVGGYNGIIPLKILENGDLDW